MPWSFTGFGLARLGIRASGNRWVPVPTARIAGCQTVDVTCCCTIIDACRGGVCVGPALASGRVGGPSITCPHAGSGPSTAAHECVNDLGETGRSTAPSEALDARPPCDRPGGIGGCPDAWAVERSCQDALKLPLDMPIETEQNDAWAVERSCQDALKLPLDVQIETEQNDAWAVERSCQDALKLPLDMPIETEQNDAWAVERSCQDALKLPLDMPIETEQNDAWA